MAEIPGIERQLSCAMANPDFFTIYGLINTCGLFLSSDRSMTIIWKEQPTWGADKPMPDVEFSVSIRLSTNVDSALLKANTGADCLRRIGSGYATMLSKGMSFFSA